MFLRRTVTLPRDREVIWAHLGAIYFAESLSHTPSDRQEEILELNPRCPAKMEMQSRPQFSHALTYWEPVFLEALRYLDGLFRGVLSAGL